MALSEYRRRRDFSRTREPPPRASARRTRRPTFVIQLHHARSRHYDFRLEVDGVLKSWAVPKGPSLNPADKRLAVEVEDHPLAYAGFEGEIAAGNYGAGSVEIFDRGTWSTAGDAAAQLEQGRLQFELFGGKLRGIWNLIRTQRKRRQPEWLLIKSRDRHAAELEADDLLDAPQPPAPQPRKRAALRTAAGSKSEPKRGGALRRILARVATLDGAAPAKLPPGPFAPELARLYPSPPEGDDWVHEVKWDGYRILCTIVDGQPTLWSRNAIEWTARLPSIVAALARLGLDSARIDGELVALVEGVSDFNALQARLSGENAGRLVYVAFDLIHLQGWSVAQCALVERKQILRSVLELKPDPALQFSEHHVGSGLQAFDAAVEHALEGILCKRAASPYRAGRGDDWRKIKRLQSDEFAIAGFTAPKGSRSGFGSLLLAAAEPDGSWRYVGRVGSGFSQAQLLDLTRSLKESRASGPSARVAAMDAALRNAHWVEPDKVAEVYYRGIGNLGLLRQPSLKTLRADKQASDLMAEATGATQKERAMPTAKRTPARKTAAKAPAPARSLKPNPGAVAAVDAAKTGTRPGKAGADAARGVIALTHPERVVFPQDGITKNEVFDYYRQVMPRLLPGLRDKPLSIVRCPSGTGGQCFFQKHLTPGLKRVGRVRLKEESGRFAEYLYIDDADGLLELVQFNAIEFHPWAAAVQDTEHAQYLVFDLDPAPDIAWLRVAAAALDVRDLLGKVGLRSFVRTTGGKGLHVVVPLNPPSRWDDAKKFSHALAQSFASSRPNEFVSIASKQRRSGRIFIDYLRNSRGATSVASYSLRARPGAPVALPLRWSELAKLPAGDAFTIRNVVARVKRLRDPWAEFSSVRQNLDRIREIGSIGRWRGTP